jgi:hypothetical protein
LVCGTSFGHLLIIRNYAFILSITDDDERARVWGQQTIILALKEPIQHLAVQGTHVTATLTTHIIFFDTRTLPNIPLIQPETGPDGHMDSRLPPIRLHSILSANPATLQHASCAQISGSIMYHAFPTLLGGMPSTESLRSGSYVLEVPERARHGGYRCIRTYDFAK